MFGAAVWQHLFVERCDIRADTDRVRGTRYYRGIKRISSVAQVLVPFMALVYVVTVLTFC